MPERTCDAHATTDVLALSRCRVECVRSSMSLMHKQMTCTTSADPFECARVSEGRSHVPERACDAHATTHVLALSWCRVECVSCTYGAAALAAAMHNFCSLS